MSKTSEAELKTGLASLADRCEKAEGPDQDLNNAIYEALGNCRHTEREVKIVDGDEDDDEDFPSIYSICKRCGREVSGTRLGLLYTASLDAAMTLVPEGMDWLVRNDEDEKFAHVTSRDFAARVIISGSESFSESTGASYPAFAATAPLALCAAALRAREMMLAQTL